MTAAAFFSLVEIKTKTASSIAFITGTLYAFYLFGTLRFLPMLLFFLSMTVFDMFTTGLNNYQDHQRAIKKEGFNYEKHNAIVHYNLSQGLVVRTLAFLFVFASACGVLLVLFTDVLVLLAGILAFTVGLMYSKGPLPISRTPFGEAASGIAMGFGIPALAVYIHAPAETFFQLHLSTEDLQFSMPWLPVIRLILITVPCIVCIANIMLANNICDREDDMANKRETLPVVYGNKKAMVLFHTLYVIAYGAILFSVLIGAVHFIVLLALATLPIVLKNLKRFRGLQTKKDTFSLSVQNFVLICTAYALLIGLGRLFI